MAIGCILGTRLFPQLEEESEVRLTDPKARRAGFEIGNELSFLSLCHAGSVPGNRQEHFCFLLLGLRDRLSTVK